MSSTPNVLQALADGFDFLRSVEANQSASAYTLDNAIQDQIDLLQQGSTVELTDPEGNDVGNRPSLYDQLTKLQQDIDSSCQALIAAGNDPAQLAALGLAPQGDDNPTLGTDDPSTSVTNSGGG